jgi:DNA-binding transcriptional ArsR family regulator
MQARAFANAIACATPVRTPRAARDPRLDFRARFSILNRMVKHEDALNRTFAALADPTRRALLARLAHEREVSVSTLAAPFAISLPAVMKHLDVLVEAGLVTREKTGRTVACRLAAGPMEDAMQWLSRYQRFWTEQLDRLAAFVEDDACLPKSTPATPAQRASSCGDDSTQVPKKSTQRGRTPRS